MRRLILTSAALLLAWLPAPLVASSVEATVAPASPSLEKLNQRGFDELNACLSTRRRADALYVMDVSGSLQFNDPEGRRFEALEASITQLGSLAGAGGTDVNVAVATFGDDFTPPASVHDWSRLPAGDSLTSYAAGVRREAEAAWEAAGTSQGTNYEAALEGAARVMRSRGSTDDACQMVLWFTDGLFSLGDPYSQTETDAASARMCARGGTLDELRRDGVSVIALALTGDDIEEQLARPEYASRRGELQAMALSQSSEMKCGTTPVPRGWRPGIFLSADEPVILGALFSGVAAQASGCVPSSIHTTLPARVPVAAGVGRFQVDLSTADARERIQLQAPGQRFIEVPPGTTSYAGSTVHLARAGSLASLQVVVGSSVAPGNWTISGPRSQPTSISLYRCSDLRITVVEPERALPGGEPSTVTAQVTDSTGSPADLTAFRGMRDGASIEAASSSAKALKAEVSDASAGQIEVQVTPPENRLSVDLTLSFTPVLKAAGGSQLSPVSASASLPVSPPGSFPTIAPATPLDLGIGQGLDPATGAWTVTGSSQGPSRVCFGPVEGVDAPADAGDVAIAVSVECQDLAKGEVVDVRVTATPEVTADGEAAAHIPVSLENADGDQIREVLDVRWELERRVDQGLRLQILLAALAVALLVPLLVLALVNFLLARFRGGDVRFGSFAVEIGEGGELTPLEPIGVRGLMSRYVQGAERRQIQSVSSGVDLVALASKNPLGSPRFVARTSPGSRIISGDLAFSGSATECDVTPGLGAIWALVIADTDLLTDDRERPTPATLLLVTREEGQEQIDRLVTRAQVALSDGRWERTRRDLREVTVQAANTGRRGSGSDEASKTDTERGESTVPMDEDPFGLEPRTDTRAPETARRRTKPSPRSTDSPSEETYEDPYA